MRRDRIRYFCLTLVFLFTLSFSFQPVFAVSSKLVLKKDMNGDRVVQLQSDLKQLGFFHQSPSGYYGDITEAAVIEFQKKYGLVSDGIAGDGTLNKIKSLLNAEKSKPVLKKGMSSQEVAAVQRGLKKLGFFTLGPTGYYGDATEAAVIKFQKKYGMVSDGIVGAGTYEKIDSLLKNTVPVKIVIDPGHGGVDEGTSKGSIVESEVTLSISKKLQAYLDDYGYDAVLTRSKNIALDSLSKRGETRQERDLSARTDIINKSGAKFFVSIHVNSLPESTSTSGSVVFYNDKYPKSKELAENIQKALNAVTASSLKRQAHDSQKADYYILRNSNVPGVLVETAFITNKKERALLMTDSFRDKLAKAILEGIEKT